MNECSFHAVMDGWLPSSDFYARTLRCAHLGAEYVHERVLIVDGRVLNHWLNRTGGNGRTRPDMIHVRDADHAERVWAQMCDRMIRGAPHGLTFAAGAFA